jgi:hypothetical protein
MLTTLISAVLALTPVQPTMYVDTLTLCAPWKEVCDADQKAWEHWMWFYEYTLEG